MLLRHFLGGLTGRGLLEDEGIEGLRGVLFSLFAGVVTISAILPRYLHKLFLSLSALPTPEPYLQTEAAFTVLMIGLPMVLAGGAAALIAPAMFPDEIDYLVLTPLPVTRRQVFFSKLGAVGIFASVFVVSGTVLFGLSFSAFSHGRWNPHAPVARVIAHLTASLGASIFAVASVAAAQGLVLVLAPRRWTRQASIALQCAALAGCCLLVPILLEIPNQRAWLASVPDALVFFPPAWFLGVEQWLLGSTAPGWPRLTAMAGAATAAAVLVAGSCYAILYRHFERIVLPPPANRRSIGLVSVPKRAGSPWFAVWRFASATLMRNRVSQLLFLVTWAVGAAVVVHWLLGGMLAPWHEAGEAAPRRFVDAAVSMPLVLMLMGVAGLRAAFLLPVNSRANWVFRLSDADDLRPGHLDGVERAFVRLALVPALILSASIQWYALPLGQAVMTSLLSVLCGGVLLEIVLRSWRRVPFTCSYIPGKRPLPLTIVLVIVAFWFFTSFGSAILGSALVHPARFLTWFGLLLALASWLRRRRLRTWGDTPLEFDDERPDRIRGLGLSER